MDMLLTASFRALKSVFAPGMFGVFLWSIFLTMLALIAFVVLAGYASGFLATQLDNPEWASILPFVGTLGAGLIAWFLFPGIMPIIVNFFDARIAYLIEARDYPESMATNPTAFWPEFWHDARFSLMAVTLNILILPLYLFMPGLHLIPFYLLNGYLLGREFFVMAARRHIPIQEALVLRRKNGRTVLIAGVGLAILATLPLVNLLAPFWGIAVMVHLFHSVSPRPKAILVNNTAY